MKSIFVISFCVLCSVFVSSAKENEFLDILLEYLRIDAPTKEMSKVVASACLIDVNIDLGNRQPLLIRPGRSEFFYPNDRFGFIRMRYNEKMELFCSNGFASPLGVGNNLITISCSIANRFNINGILYKFNEFNCRNFVEHTTIRTNIPCYNGGTLIDIGFHVENRFMKIMSVCHNEQSEQSYYSEYQLTPISIAFQRAMPRPGFRQGDFFPGKDINALYTRTTQRSTIAKITRSDYLSWRWIEDVSDIFLARGHMAARCDFIYGNQQRATFYFINASPQWQTFNALNWAAVEDGSRRLAANRNIKLDVYTGTFGITTLKDINGIGQEIFLDINNKQVPVPKIFYKVLINRAARSGVVLIGVNNPHLTLKEIMKDYIICFDVSAKIHYINWRKEDIRRGYSYACEVNDFLKAVPHISSVDVQNLLI